jgi:cellulose biosynthesis protein BcsQ
MQIVTIANAKGGTCKTTTTALLAVRAMQDNRRASSWSTLTPIRSTC